MAVLIMRTASWVPIAILPYSATGLDVVILKEERGSRVGQGLLQLITADTKILHFDVKQKAEIIQQCLVASFFREQLMLVFGLIGKI